MEFSQDGDWAVLQSKKEALVYGWEYAMDAGIEGEEPMNYSLLIWQEVPENIKLYLIPNDEIDPEARKVLETVHGYYINASNTNKEIEEALSLVDCALVSSGERKQYEEEGGDAFGSRGVFDSEEQVPERWKGCWGDYKVFDEQSKREQVNGTITNVYVSGFLMQAKRENQMPHDIGDRQPLDRLVASGQIKGYKETKYGWALTFNDGTVVEFYAAECEEESVLAIEEIKD